MVIIFYPQILPVVLSVVTLYFADLPATLSHFHLKKCMEMALLIVSVNKLPKAAISVFN